MTQQCTLDSVTLRARVEDYMNAWIPDDLWQKAETQARRKFNTYRDRFPNAEHYNDDYLIILTADTVTEQEFRNRSYAAYQFMKE